MEIVKDLLIVSGRIFTILPLLLIIALFMGRRSIGELPVFDFFIVISLGAVVGADIADPDIHHIHTVAAIILIAFLQRIVVLIKLSKRKAGKFLSFPPVIVIENGSLLKGNLKSIGYPIDNILMMLREKEVFNIEDVKLAVVEANGTLSI
ncbi:DUF421 domain-containing protein [Metabacillus lacus]|uniref:DUF421 domain-containing protein n=1 Tax=Metabacillus lacus TaxID=1983721 RepID=UPI003CCE2F76